MVLVPSPFGRGLGRGWDLNSSPAFLFYSPPHPGLLPKGEGAKQKKVFPCAPRVPRGSRGSRGSRGKRS
jgi:hypothetical protein